MMSSAKGHPYLRFPFRIVLTLALLGLGCWSVAYSWPQQLVRYNRFSFTEDEARQVKNFSKAQYAYGINAWLNMQPEKAGLLFQKAVSLNVLNIDAWLKLAEIEMEQERKKRAKEILDFVTTLTDRVYRWKWQGLILARELGMDKLFYDHINYLLSKRKLVQDSFQLVHTQLAGNATAVVGVLEPPYRTDYLEWLMRWGMPDESAVVWEAMSEDVEPEKEIALRYAHFLLSHKRIIASRDIWQNYTGSSGLTNAGFEEEITGQGYDWRYWDEKSGKWALKRASYQAAEGEYALKITFNGKENISFHHLFQIFTVDPKMRYRLTYEWKSRGITTDKGPFVDIYGYDQKRLYQAGPMITGSNGWHEISLEFETPDDCHAAVVRLRRDASMRFDSKIRGIVWIDNFRLEEMGELKVDSSKRKTKEDGRDEIRKHQTSNVQH